MIAEINTASYQLSSSGRMKTSPIITNTKRSNGKGWISIGKSNGIWTALSVTFTAPWSKMPMFKMLSRHTLKKKGHTPELKWKQVCSLSAFHRGAEVCLAITAGLQPVLVCYLGAAKGGKSPAPEAVPPLIYSEAFIIELISALQRDCQ